MRISSLVFVVLSAPALAHLGIACAQEIPAQEALRRTQINNVLTYDGAPFHAILEIAPDDAKQEAFRGRVEVFWAEPEKYRLVLTTSDFHQVRVVDHEAVQETDLGDFYPNWLHGFVTALLDPMPRIKDLARENSTVSIGQPNTESCIRHEDKPGGVTNELTFSFVCLQGAEPRLQFALDFSYNMKFSDYRSFGPKWVARTYLAGTKGHEQVRGTLITLEPWIPEADSLTVSRTTPAAEQIQTTLVSTLTQESMVDRAPGNVVWPGVWEGKTSGYMIVHAVTDRTGQVREASKHNSDNSALEDFGVQLALRYKFEPLIIDGVPRQMEMPLVLHFESRLENPIPELDDATSRKLISGCSIPRTIDDRASAGKQIVIQIQVQDDGHIMTLGSSDRKIAIPSLYQQFRRCHFAEYKQYGVRTAYHLNLNVLAR